MTPRRPYLLRALYEWLIDNELTPHLVVDAEFPGTQIPREYVQDGQIVLNIAPGAVQSLRMENNQVQFHARFNGQDQRVYLPMGSLLAIYARENGAGTIFEPEQGLLLEDVANENTHAPSEDSQGKPSGKGKPTLSVVK